MISTQRILVLWARSTNWLVCHLSIADRACAI